MIDSEFCIKCNRPYATKGFPFCDSCLKTIEHDISKMPEKFKFNFKEFVKNEYNNGKRLPHNK